MKEAYDTQLNRSINEIQEQHVKTIGENRTHLMEKHSLIVTHLEEEKKKNKIDLLNLQKVFHEA